GNHSGARAAVADRAARELGGVLRGRAGRAGGRGGFAFGVACCEVGGVGGRGLPPKPVIDILAGAQSLDEAPAIATQLAPLGFVQIPFRPANPDAPVTERLFFLKRPLAMAAGAYQYHSRWNV